VDRFGKACGIGTFFPIVPNRREPGVRCTGAIRARVVADVPDRVRRQFEVLDELRERVARRFLNAQAFAHEDRSTKIDEARFLFLQRTPAVRQHRIRHVQRVEFREQLERTGQHRDELRRVGEHRVAKGTRGIGHVRAGDAFPEFLVLWALFPIVFFSFSGSKLPGYILPSLPPLAILTGDYLFRIRRGGIPVWLRNTHAAFTGILTFVLLLCPQYMVYQRIVPAPKIFVWSAIAGVAAALLVIFVVHRSGVRRIAIVTLVPLAALLFFLLGMNGHLLDLNYSARPLAREIAQAVPASTPVAEVDVRRDIVYGLAFYRNQPVLNYKAGGVPDGAHILVIPTHEASKLNEILQGRLYQQLFLYETQGLSVYKVYPRS